MITVLLFARLREAVGRAVLELDLAAGEATVERLLAELAGRYPAVGFDNVMVAVNEQYAHAADIIPPGSTVALIPPVSGG